MNSLKEQIISANKSYREGVSLITDSQYDDLLEELESQMGIIEFECFKQTLTESKGTIKLDYVLGSLTKFKYDEPENLYKWVKKHSIKSLFASLKVDGCSFAVSYRNGILTQCSSRGDSETGTDWTDKAKYILPTVISYLGDLDIRGEFTLTDDSHVKLGYIDRRGGTVGIMNKDIVQPEKLKFVKAICYEVLTGTMEIEEQFSFLKQNNFLTPEVIIFPTVTNNSHEALKSYYEDMKAYVNFDIDGLVVSSPNHIRENVFFPETKIAFKINDAGVKTTIIGIEWNISKGGLCKPVLLVAPTVINGRTINRVTGNNYQYMCDNGLGIGAEVLIIFSGMVIPKIIETLVKVDPSKTIIKTCPSCGMLLQMKSVDLVCNNIHCGDKTVKEVSSFLIKNGVEGCTDTSLTNWGISTFEDLLSFKSDGSKSQHKFISELIKNIFSKQPEDLFANMNFDGAGKTNIDKILDFYGNGNDIEYATRNLYINKVSGEGNFPEGIGDKVIAKIESDWKRNIETLKLIMSDSRYNPNAKSVKVASTGNLSGESFLITGTLSEGRKQIEALIVSNGGTIASSVSKSLSHLVCGADAGSKLTKAEKLGISIITEDQLREMI